MCRLAVITPCVLRIRINRLVEHLETRNIEQYEKCSMKYRNVDIEKVSGLSTKFMEDMLDALFQIELLVGLNVFEQALQLLLQLKVKVIEEENNNVMIGLLSSASLDNDIILGDIASLPMLTRHHIADYLRY
jgi:hypothetical protein